MPQTEMRHLTMGWRTLGAVFASGPQLLLFVTDATIILNFGFMKFLKAAVGVIDENSFELMSLTSWMSHGSKCIEQFSK